MNMNLTFPGTHKLIKRVYQKEAFNVEEVNDDIYIMDAKSQSYQKLDLEAYHNIQNGNVRF